MTDDSTAGSYGFDLQDLAAIALPASPVVLGKQIVYVLRRTDVAEHKTRASLWAVPLAGGEPRRLTQGAWADRSPVADRAGRFVLFVSSRGHGDQVYRLDGEGGDARRLTQLPRGMIGDTALSPDGARLALVLSPAAPADDDLPLAADLVRTEPDLSAREAEAAPVVEPPAPPPPPSSPRARVIVRVRNRDDAIGWFGGARSHVWIVDVATGAARRVTAGARDFQALAWAPGGDALVAVASHVDPTSDPDFDSLRNDLVRIDPVTGDLAPIAKPDGAVMAPSISPRGDLVAYLHVPPDDPFGARNVVVWVSPIGGFAAPRALTAALDRPAIDLCIDDLAGGMYVPVRPIWSSAGDRLTLVVTDRASVRLYDQPVDGSPGRYLTAEGRAVSAPEPGPDGDMAVLVADRAHFAEVGRVTARGEVAVLTRHNVALEARVGPRLPELVRIEHDGVTLEGYYLAPRRMAPGTRRPAILYIHGGPHCCYGERLFFEMQWLADCGFAVLFTNPRGSHSFGEAYSIATEFHWGDPDTSDQLAFADWLAARPEVDPERIGVTGGSYGGFMTAHLCGTTDRFKAAVAQRAVYDWATSVGGCDYGHESRRSFEGAWPWTDPERYLAMSPIRNAHRIRTPMLIVHNEGDLRIAYTQALELFCALKAQGTPTALVLFPEESHGMSRGGRIDRRLERLRQIRGWFERWL